MLIKAPGTRKKKRGEVPTLRLFVFPLCLWVFFTFSVVPKCKAVCQSWMKKKKTDGGGKKNNRPQRKNKPNTDSCNSPGGESFLFGVHWDSGRLGAPPWGSSGSQVERGEMGGEFPPRSLTVLTTAHWLDVASSLKCDTQPCGAGRCARPQGGRRQ